MRKLVVFLIIIVLIGAIMFFTNPSEDNFTSHLLNISERNVTRYASGTQGSTETADTSAAIIAADLARAKFLRKNYYIYSLYEITSPNSVDGTIYLGVFKIFIKLN